MVISKKGIWSMKNPLIRCLYKTLPLAFVLLLLHPGLMAADPSSQRRNPEQSTGRYDRDQGREADFLFSAPKGFLGFRIGRFFPRAQGILFDELTDVYTLEKNDFRAWNFGFDGGVDLNERVELVISLDYMTRTKKSEYREYEDLDGLPIVQETNYAQLPLTAGLKFLLIPRGKHVGQYAWLPSRVVPYLSAGAGIEWYRFRQAGDFIDFSYEDLPIYTDEVESNGWTPVGYLGGGVDINVHTHTYVTFDLRYTWARPELDLSFARYDPVELSGLRASVGLQWHF